MFGIHTYRYENYTVKFDFDKYMIQFMDIMPIKVNEKMKEDEEYKFLYDCLIIKNDYIKDNYLADKNKYNTLLQEYNKRYNTNF